MDVLNHTLKVVEAACFGKLDLSREIFDEVLVDDAIGGSKESKDVLDEVLLRRLELIGLSFVLAQIDFFRDPETGYGLLVKLPVVIILNRKENKSRGLSFKEGFGFKVGATDGFRHSIFKVWSIVSVIIIVTRRRGGQRRRGGRVWFSWFS